MGGVGGIALGSLLKGDGLFAATAPVNPLAPKPPHFAPKAKSCIFFFLSGGTSQLDLFDFKPKLKELHGQPLPESMTKDVRFAFIQKDSAVLMASPREFKRYGQSGLEMSDLLPKIGEHVDDIALIRSMHTEQFNHHPASIFMNTGFARMGRPSIGSWLTYGLGSVSENLPGYVVLQPIPGIRGGATHWSSGFLPSTYQGVLFSNQGDPVKNLGNPAGLTPELQRASLDTIASLNARAHEVMEDPEIESRIASYELAYRMQSAAPELIDLSGESAQTVETYGVNRASGNEKNFATSCLLARRMVERGVRFVNIYMDGWDQHGDLNNGLKGNCNVVDQPIAALLGDLKQRGLLDSTLVVWGTEFGRTPLAENRAGLTPNTGRDHHPFAFSTWMAGGGVKGGQVIGATDDIGWNITEDPVHMNDFHATLLHLFGMNHEKLTYRFQGRDFRLTDVAGNVVQKLVA